MNFFEPYKRPSKAVTSAKETKPLTAVVADTTPRPAVTVLLLTYNADPEKLKMTVRSILAQKQANFEVVIADDGSKVRWDDLLETWFREADFANYRFANSPENGGTCKNVQNGLRAAKGRYTKAISPGDLLYDPYTLYHWVSFMEETGCRISFADAVYYNREDTDIQVLQTANAPCQKKLYHGNHRRGLFVDYLLANDSLSGATTMMDTALMAHYLDQMVGKVVYAEDYMLRIAVFESEKIGHHSRCGVWYEYGTGVSTAQSEKWAALLKKDFDACNDIIAQSAPCDRLAKRYVKYLAFSGSDKLRKIYKCLLFPDMIWWRLKNRLFGAKTPAEGNTDFILSLMDR